ncbi:olfactory receptor 5M11-like [Mus caroli]|uniref:Olfactory receptor 5M11-like n=1 Tax=Mus caroli TaxID=10089 RepID=A0A6P5QKR5_MUSCR|nr:olfactory receptor 5M11-like [Mus caroli]
MPHSNSTKITEFILLGLTDRPELQPLLFVLFLFVYIVTVLGNMGMMALIRLDSRLHKPMYFFLSNLAFVDLCYTSTATPQMLTNFLSDKKTISFIGCFIQCYLFIALLLTEFYMLAAMAYDLSYAFIIAAILRIKSAEGRRKAFSTCGSHMMAVTLFYGTLFCMYVRPPTDKTVEESKIIAVFYTFVSPLLNPLIYSLRNKDVKQALKTILRQNVIRTVLMPPPSNKLQQ